jgi:predicted O-methyltransferase YrrM
MFHEIPKPILDRMRELEEADARDRLDGTSLPERLRQITPDTGRFLAMLAAMAPPGIMVEIGTSAGYSSLWLALACRQAGRRLKTFEVLEDKARLAAETFRRAGVHDIVEVVLADVRDRWGDLDDIAFCFLDAEKAIYAECYEAVVPRLVPGGIFVADNATSHAEVLAPLLEHALKDPRIDAMIVPVGRGELLCRKA